MSRKRYAPTLCRAGKRHRVENMFCETIPHPEGPALAVSFGDFFSEISQATGLPKEVAQLIGLYEVYAECREYLDVIDLTTSDDGNEGDEIEYKILRTHRKNDTFDTYPLFGPNGEDLPPPNITPYSFKRGISRWLPDWNWDPNGPSWSPTTPVYDDAEDSENIMPAANLV
jgi:hypothetical protein